MARSLINCLSIFDCEPLAVVRLVSSLPLLQSFLAGSRQVFVNKFFFFSWKTVLNFAITAKALLDLIYFHFIIGHL